MIINLKYNITHICEYVLKLQLDALNLDYKISDFNEVVLIDTPTDVQIEQLTERFKIAGIEIIESQKSITVQKIKDAITEMVYSNDNQITHKGSVYLSEKLNHTYGYLANLFSEVTFTSIEYYIIMQKIERVKQLLLIDQLTLTEIAFNLNYSSVAHLSTQFKKTTGLTPTAFQKIIAKRQDYKK